MYITSNSNKILSPYDRPGFSIVLIPVDVSVFALLSSFHGFSASSYDDTIASQSF